VLHRFKKITVRGKLRDGRVIITHKSNPKGYSYAELIRLEKAAFKAFPLGVNVLALMETVDA